AVAARGGLAQRGAGVGVDHVAVVAVLGRLHDPVAARLERTALVAAVIGRGVAVVAGLDAVVDEAVAAGGERAAARARVGVDGVAVIARPPGTDHAGTTQWTGSAVAIAGRSVAVAVTGVAVTVARLAARVRVGRGLDDLGYAGRQQCTQGDRGREG